MLSLLGGVFLGWSLGANDASNVFGSAVASRMLKFWTAAVLAAVFVLLGALLQGQAGIDADALGRSVLERLFSGAGVSLLVALVSVSLSAIIGIVVGLTAGYLGGWVDRVISRLIEIFLAFPGILLAIALVVVQAWIGMVCPLTAWEDMLRGAAGERTYAGTFVGDWVSRAVYLDAPQWVVP